MRIFNKGRRTFTMFDSAFGPGFHDVKPEHEKHVQALMTKYPQEIVEAGAAAGEIHQKNEVIQQQAQDIAKLNVQVKKLQALLTEAPKSNDSKAVANRRADEAEEKLAEATAEIDRLKGLLAGTKAAPSA